MSEFDYDAIVIGSGPAGEGAAMKLAKIGKDVAVVERYARVGGGCTHWGTIPSKALRHAIQMAGELRQNAVFKKLTNGGLNQRIDVPDLLSTARSVIERQVVMREGFYERNSVPVISGDASFLDAHTLEVVEPDGSVTTISAQHIVIATGSRPYRPEGVDFDHPRIFDADKILSLSYTPRSITVYGAGVIGCEYASMFRSLGIKVNLVNTRAKLLEFLDDEIIDALAYHMRDMGTIIRHNETFDSVYADEREVVVDLHSGKKLRTDILLWANGRAANTEGLELGRAGIETDTRGRVFVNENYQSEQPHIYAVGDVIGPPGLASASYDQGRFAATHLATGECESRLINSIPNGIYTNPEISSVGCTERELTEQKIPYEVGHAQFKSLARAQIMGRTTGMLKLLFHRETLEILGIHCFGQAASEIVHIGQAIMCQPAPNNSLMYFVNTTFNYPTMAEAYRVAALNGLNRVEGN